ncbi:alpha/beta hydrolase fold domain-containing protein [Streptomyces klenkii]
MKYPAALEDTVAAYRVLLTAGFAAHRTAIAGDSSGGALALAAAMTFRGDDTPVPGHSRPAEAVGHAAT